MEKFAKFARIAEIEFSDIVLSTHLLDLKLRVYFKDKSYLDFFFTTRLKEQRFSIHWERNHVDKTIYRLDNTPDIKWKRVQTYPFHFHDGKYDKVKQTPFFIKDDFRLEEVFRNFLQFARKIFAKKNV